MSRGALAVRGGEWEESREDAEKGGNQRLRFFRATPVIRAVSAYGNMGRKLSPCPGACCLPSLHIAFV